MMIGLFHWKEGLSHDKLMECLAKRLDYTMPEKMHMFHEVWPATSGSDLPGVVSIFEVPDYAPLMEVELFWSEYFDIKFLPVISAEDGIKLGKDIMTQMMATA
jgi:hypothetical protein